MTIKQNGGIFGRNPTFNEVDATDITTESLSLLKNNPFVRLDDSDTNNNGEFRLDNTSVRIEADKDNAVAGSKIKFKIDNSEIGFFDENGHLDIDGNLVVASGQGIDFSATSGTGTSELFDDYEEGTWTPTFQGSTSGSISFASAGYYTKIGRIVRASFYLTSKDFSAAAIVGTLEIAGLPYNVGVLGQGLGNLAVNNFIAGASDYVPYAYSTDRLRVSKGTTSTVTDADLTQSTSRAIAVSITYMAS
jgi:hypothetical protein